MLVKSTGNYYLSNSYAIVHRIVRPGLGQAQDVARSVAMGLLCRIASEFNTPSILESSEHQITQHLESETLQIPMDMRFATSSYDYDLM